MRRTGFALPAPSHYGVGMVMLPTYSAGRRFCEETFERIVLEEGQTFLGWRDVPTDNERLGPRAKSAEPFMRQVFIGRRDQSLRSPDSDGLAFERKLFVIRKRVENAVRQSGADQREMFYVPSLSSRTLIYKGMLDSVQLDPYFPDLHDPDMTTALALVHSRFSTNTFPTWAHATPIVTSATTARSTPSAATSTGCAPARACSAPSCSGPTSTKSCRSSTRPAAIRPCSTMPWNCWCWPAGRCRTP